MDSLSMSLTPKVESPVYSKLSEKALEDCFELVQNKLSLNQ